MCSSGWRLKIMPPYLLPRKEGGAHQGREEQHRDHFEREQVGARQGPSRWAR